MYVTLSLGNGETGLHQTWHDRALKPRSHFGEAEIPRKTVLGSSPSPTVNICFWYSLLSTTSDL